MKRSIPAAAAFFLFLLPLKAWTQAHFTELANAGSFRCVYLSETYGYWGKSDTFAGIGEKGSDVEPVEEMTLHSIDLYEGRAVLKTAFGEWEVSAINGIKGLTFIDFGNSGAVRMVTIFPYLCPERNAFCSVFSEHAGRSGVASPTQAFGFCTAH